MKVLSRLWFCPKCGKQHGPTLEFADTVSQKPEICSTCLWGNRI